LRVLPLFSPWQREILVNRTQTIKKENNSSRYSRSLFGDEDPLEKTIQGVVSEVPANSHIEFNMLVSASTLEALNGEVTFARWFDNWVPVRLLTKNSG